MAVKLFKDYEMILYGVLGVLFALSVLIAVLDKKISHGIFFFLAFIILAIPFFVIGAIAESMMLWLL